MEHSAGIILFRKIHLQREYLLLKSTYITAFWGFSKGHGEPGETEQQTALREAEEETNLKEIILIPQFKEKTSFFKTVEGEKVFKEVHWFLGEAKDKSEGKVSEEHQELRWLAYSEAKKLLTFKQDKELLEKAKEHMQKI